MSVTLTAARPADMAAYQFGGSNSTASSPSLWERVKGALAPENPVTGERQFLRLIPESWEKAIGKYSIQSEVNRRGLSYKKGVVELTEKVCRRLAPVTDRQLDYTVKVLDSGIQNAAAAPGGHTVMFRGMVEGILNEKNDFGLGPIDTESKVAAVMAHEFVHAAAGHGVRGVEFGLFLTGFIWVAATVAQYALRVFANKENVPGTKALAEGLANAIEMIYDYLGGLIAVLWRASYDRTKEDESDRYGMLYLQRAGYNPKAMIWLMRYFDANEAKFPIEWIHHVDSWFQAHDLPGNRAKKCEQNLIDLEAGLIRTSPTSSYKA